MSADKPFEFTPIEAKLITLGLNEAATLGEVQNCGIKLMELMRSRNISPEQLLKSIAETPVPEDKPIWARVRMPFGKYTGRAVQDVSDLEYLLWFSKMVKNKPLHKCVIKQYLAHIGYGPKGRRR